jgi:nucleoside-diphosphate-sugar epimerase
MASKELVLITGATGHLGFKTLLLLLSAGYRARIAIRSESKQRILTENPAFKALKVSAETYEFVVVPDITATDAYFEAVKGVSYIIHIASPLGGPEQDSTEEYRKYFVEPAVNATVAALEAAKRESSVKRVVITSSVAALIPFSVLARPHEDNEWFTADGRAPDDNGPYAASMHAYVASKVNSLNAAESWIKANNPHFDLVKIHPSFLEGRNELILKPEDAFSGTNALMLAVATGNEFPKPMSSSTVHNDDAARLHVEALKSSIPAGSYVANGPLMSWSELPGLVVELFPEAVKDGRLSDKGNMVGVASHFDTKKTEETFGWKFQDFKSQVKSVVGHYLELLDTAKAG